jgi:hypothetical protein
MIKIWPRLHRNTVEERVLNLKFIARNFDVIETALKLHFGGGERLQRKAKHLQNREFSTWLARSVGVLHAVMCNGPKYLLQTAFEWRKYSCLFKSSLPDDGQLKFRRTSVVRSFIASTLPRALTYAASSKDEAIKEQLLLDALDRYANDEKVEISNQMHRRIDRYFDQFTDKMFTDLELERVATAFPRVKGCVGFTTDEGGQAAGLMAVYAESQRRLSYKEIKDRKQDEHKAMISSLRSQLFNHNVDSLFAKGKPSTGLAAPSGGSWFDQVENFNPLKQEYYQFVQLAASSLSSQEGDIKEAKSETMPSVKEADPPRPVPTDQELYDCCRERFIKRTRKPYIELNVISDNSNKHRVISIANAEEAYLAQNLNKKLLKGLKRVSSVEALLKGREATLRRECLNSSLYSADLSKATDYIPLNVAKVFLEKYMRRLAISEPEIQVALKIIGPHAIQHGNIHKRGLFMGLGISWTILCLINDFCARDAGAQKGTYAIHGDDLIGFWSRDLKERYENNITSLGLVINNSKSFYGPNGVFCERFLQTDLKLDYTNRVYNPYKFSYIIGPEVKQATLARSKQVMVTSVSFNRLAECGGVKFDYETNKVDLSNQLLKIRSPFREIRNLVQRTLKRVCLYIKQEKGRKPAGKLFKGRMDCGGNGLTTGTSPLRTLAFIKNGSLIRSSTIVRSAIYRKAMAQVLSSTDVCVNNDKGLDIRELELLLVSAERRKALLTGAKNIPKNTKFNPKDITLASIQAKKLGRRILQSGKPVEPVSGFNSRSKSKLRHLSLKLISHIKGNRTTLAHMVSRRAIRILQTHKNRQSWSLNWARDWINSYDLEVPSDQSGQTLYRYQERITPVKVRGSEFHEDSNPVDSSYRLGDIQVEITDHDTVIGSNVPKD